MNTNDQKRLERAEYRAQLVEAELNAVRQSKSYKIMKSIGIIRAQLKSDPIGLSKKAARILLKEPKKAKHLFRSANRGAFIAQSVMEQNAKYQEWILLNEPDEAELNEQRLQSERFVYKPLISILTPVFNPPVSVLEELIESVLEQTYSNFELCLGDFGDNPDVRKAIEKYTKLDPRVKLYIFTENKGIAGNSNQVLDKVNGDFVALLDHDDTLSPDALFENVKMLNIKPYDFLYSDKDKIDENNNRFDPLFKPQLSPEMLLNINYLTHLNVMRTSIVRDIGGWDPETDGAQDWDIFLRVLDASKHVAHIPKVLYHWRVIASSTAMSIDTKPYALAGQRKAIDKYLAKNDIPATAYHEKTELFLKWDKTALDNEPLVFISYSNLPNTLRLQRHVRKAVESPTFVILVEGKNSLKHDDVVRHIHADVLYYESENFSKVLGEFLKSHNKAYKNKIALFLKDDIRLPKKVDWYANLTGWLGIKDVGAVCGRLVDRHDLIVSSGGVISPDLHYQPLFYKYPRYYQSYIGNAEWVRNLSILSSAFCATTIASMLEFDFTAPKKFVNILDDYFLWLSRTKRLVMTPHATASIFEDDNTDLSHSISLQSKDKGKYQDPFGNPNMSAADPLRLFEDEAMPGAASSSENDESMDRYQHDAVILADTFDITREQMDANRKIVSDLSAQKDPKSVAWFLPSYDSVYAGLMNIFSFANFLATEKGLKTTVYVLTGTGDISQEQKLAAAAYPALEKATFVGITPNQVERVQKHDIGIATQWATTFPLAKATNIFRKCYFIQDNEANFYPKGSISSLVELSYGFGFMAIANTEGLLEMYKKKYQGHGVASKSLVDLSAYYPRKDKYYKVQKPYKVFFYARPNMPRNAFELGVAGLKRLKQEYGDEVEIITAGASWRPEAYGVAGLFTNLNKIAYEAVPKLYRSVDAGLMFMFSGHPGVTASELMASGCPVVVNEYDDQTWHELYRHEKTCLITRPTASEVARNLKRCLTEPELRKKIIDGGLKKTATFYGGYEASLQSAYEAIVAGK